MDKMFFKNPFRKIKKEKFEAFSIKSAGIVATASLNKKLDLEKISKIEGTYYEPKKFPFLILKIKKSRILIFENGNIIVENTKTIEETKEIFKKTMKFLNIEFKNKQKIIIQNVR
jgi:TATA-box binding protein (TBP) (component of TFIID and TFIIIB)